jgi:hypothetical protein
MNEDQIKLLIERLEPYAAQNPGKYRLRLTALAALGYAYLLSVVVGLLTLAFVILAYVRFNAITIKIAWIPLVIAWLVLRSLWITIPPPDGIEIKHDQGTRAIRPRKRDAQNTRWSDGTSRPTFDRI